MNAWVRGLREAAWLREERVVAYASMAVAAYAVAALLLVATAHDGMDRYGHPLGTDFVSFWAAGSLALDGHAAAAYDGAAHAAREATMFGGATVPRYVWSYPPIFLLIVTPLALLPYGWALLCWLVATGAGYLACLRRVMPHPRTVLLALAFPAAMVNVGHGQNGFLSAALLGFGLLALDRRPLLAGILLGALCYKPQVALLVPVALLAGRHWRALAAMALTLAALYLGTLATFGSDIWPLALDALRGTGQARVLEQGAVDYYKMVSVFAAVRQLGGAVSVAWSAQCIASMAMALCVAACWSSTAPAHLKAALLVAATPLAAPLFLDYDLLVLALPMAWLAGDGLQRGFLPWERFALVLAFVLPGVARPFGAATGIPLGPLLELALLTAVLRRQRIESVQH